MEQALLRGAAARFVWGADIVMAALFTNGNTCLFNPIAVHPNM